MRITLSIRTIVIVAVLGFACSASATLFDVGGFEGYVLGNLPGQDSWVDDTTNSSYGMIQVIADPTGSSMGNVIMIDPPGTDGGWLGAARPFGPSTLRYITIEWEQYRTGLTDNLWVADSVAFDNWWAIQWDQNFQASSYFYVFGVPVSTGMWQHVIYTIDTIGGTATVDIVGSGSFSSPQPDLSIGGIVFELEPTASGGADGPTYIDNLVVKESSQISPVPEPCTLALLGIGITGGWLLRRRFKN